MSYIKFESSRVKEAEREGIRKARENVLKKAKKDYERRKEQEIQAKLRGDDKWILPSVEARLGHESRKAKDKKKSKHKKKKKKSKKHSSSSSDSESDCEEEWVEKSTSDKNEKISKNTERKKNVEPDVSVERDEWMNLPGLIPCVSRQELKQIKTGKDQKNEDEKNILDKMGQSERELNPYWKDGGTGLPEGKPNQNFGRNVGGVGDKGADWLKRALRRVHEQAEEEGRSLEEVAAERWGSLDKLKSMIKEAEGRIGRRHYGQGDQKCSPPHHSDSRRSGFQHSQREKDEWRGKERYEHHQRKGIGYNRDQSEYHGRREPLPGSSSLSSVKFKKPSDFDERGGPSLGFRKPADNDLLHDSRYSGSSRSGSKSANWRKKDTTKEVSVHEEVKKKREECKRVSSSESSSEDERKESGRRKEEEEDKGKILTDQEMNELGAKLVKAEIMGNETLARELKMKLETARSSRKKLLASAGDGPEKQDRSTKEEEVVVLTRTSKQGFSRPVLSSEEKHSVGGKKRREKVETHADGKRVRYFADDDKYSLKEMFEREKLDTAQDSNELFSKLASKGVGKPDSVHDMDDIFEENARFTKSAQKLEVLDRSRAIAEHKKADKALENCQWCFDSKLMLKHLIVAIGTKAFLCLPPCQSLTEGHCMIVPMYHTSCATMADEDVWNEIQEFRKSLTKMFLEMDQDCVFFETAINLRHFPHMVLECVPMEKETGDLAPIYFKKAIQECEMEWSNNKKVVDLGPKDVRKAVPKGLPYFCVDFGLQNGFAHVIEDERQWPSNFAQEIIGGMLDLDHQLWRKRRNESFDNQRKKVLQFAKWWKPHDWTQKLKAFNKSDSEWD